MSLFVSFLELGFMRCVVKSEKHKHSSTKKVQKETPLQARNENCHSLFSSAVIECCDRMLAIPCCSQPQKAGIADLSYLYNRMSNLAYGFKG